MTGPDGRILWHAGNMFGMQACRGPYLLLWSMSRMHTNSQRHRRGSDAGEVMDCRPGTHAASHVVWA